MLVTDALAPTKPNVIGSFIKTCDVLAKIRVVRSVAKQWPGQCTELLGSAATEPFVMQKISDLEENWAVGISIHFDLFTAPNSALRIPAPPLHARQTQRTTPGTNLTKVLVLVQ